jgi:hypothetical protein
MIILSRRYSQYTDDEATMNLKLKLVATTVLLVTSASTFAARVESEDAQVYGTKANSTRQVVGSVSMPDAEKCDFGQPVVIQSRLSTGETAGRAVCSKT